MHRGAAWWTADGLERSGGEGTQVQWSSGCIDMHRNRRIIRGACARWILMTRNRHRLVRETAGRRTTCRPSAVDPSVAPVEVVGHALPSAAAAGTNIESDARRVAIAWAKHARRIVRIRRAVLTPAGMGESIVGCRRRHIGCQSEGAN